MKKRIFYSLLSFLFVSSSFSSYALADDDSSGGISLNPVEHEVQNPDISSWYDLDTSKYRGKTITLEARLYNSAKDERTITLEGTNVITVQNGGLDFVDEPETVYTGVLDSNVLMKERILGLPKTVTLKPGEERIVSFDIEVPREGGQFIAGLTYINDDGQTEEEKNKNSDGGSIQIKQQLRFATTILMTNSQDERQEIQVNNVALETDRGSPRVLIDLDNPSTMMESTIIGYKITERETGEVAFEGETSGFLMAPKTYIKYPVTWDGKLGSGEYDVEIIVKQKMNYGDEEDETEGLTERVVKKSLEVKEEELEEIEETDDIRIVEKEKESTPKWIWYLIGGLGGVLLLVLVLFVVILNKLRKDNKEEE